MEVLNVKTMYRFNRGQRDQMGFYIYFREYYDICPISGSL
jgi:hypothetical protein